MLFFGCKTSYNPALARSTCPAWIPPSTVYTASSHAGDLDYPYLCRPLLCQHHNNRTLKNKTLKSLRKKQTPTHPHPPLPCGGEAAYPKISLRTELGELSESWLFVAYGNPSFCRPNVWCGSPFKPPRTEGDVGLSEWEGIPLMGGLS